MKINMSHGSGGQSTSEVVEIFAQSFQNEILAKMEDAAVVSASKKIACTTDSFVITPIFYPGGDIGKLSVCGTVNDLLMMGALPKYITLGLIIEEGMDFDDLKKIAISIAKTASEAGVQIIAGDTKVIEGKGGIYINTTGIGFIEEGRNIGASQCKNGDAIILSGNLGDHHSCILSSRMGIQNDIQSDNTPLNRPVSALLEGHIKIKAMRDVTRGGLGTILNELALSSNLHAQFEENKLPINPTVRGLCDILGLDPLYMGNEGKFVAVVDFGDAEKAIELLKQFNESRDACIIGSFSEGSGVSMITVMGTQRKIDVLYGEGLPRIC